MGTDDILGGGNTICQARRHSYGGLREHTSIQMGTWRGKLEEATGEREWTWAGWRMEGLKDDSLEENPKTAREASKWLLCCENFSDLTEYRTQEG